MPWLDVTENVGFGLVGNVSREERDARVALAIERVGLSGHRNALPRELSGGQAQRAAIARALVCEPEVLLMDEPFGALDPFTRAGLQEHLLTLWADKRPTLLIVTHDAEEAALLGDRVIVFQPSPGRVAATVRIDEPRPRVRNSHGLEQVKHRLLELLDNTFRQAGHTEQRSRADRDHARACVA